MQRVKMVSGEKLGTNHEYCNNASSHGLTCIIQEPLTKNVRHFRFYSVYPTMLKFFSGYYEI